MKRNTKVGGDKSEIVSKMPAVCADESLAVEFFERMRWQGTPACPHCGSATVYQMQGRDGRRNARFLWRCRGCGDQFTVRVGTVLEDSRIPLRHWACAFWAACASKKGVSALQIKRMTGLSYKSALFMMHRVRFAMSSDHSGQAQLTGTVEADETYVGGKPRYHGKINQGKLGHGTDKAPVVAMVERGGRARAFHVSKLRGFAIENILREHVDRKSRLMTDESPLYKYVGKEFKGGHGTVRHSKREYVRGDVHSNTIESFFALFKRGLVGTFHSVSRQHLHYYLSEFEFRYNSRKIDDGARTALAIQNAVGKKLFYRTPAN